jgi:hypothetical protein
MTPGRSVAAAGETTSPSRMEQAADAAGATASHGIASAQLVGVAVVALDDQQELAHPGRWLLRLVIGEVARQAKSKAAAATGRRPEIRHKRGPRRRGRLRDLHR